MTPRLRLAAWALGVLYCLAAVVTALTAPRPPPVKPLTDDVARAIYVELAQGEPAHRAQTSEDYASDPWSRDDAFAALEGGRAVVLKYKYGLTVQDVYRAFDEGLRQRWPLPPGTERPRATVAPLRPRPFD
ncbi:MAG: hypothetical protein IT380_09770 [Myxococcales bacterium]|nr:hypothetical protein [Myxococcales bacterium]